MKISIARCLSVAFVLAVAASMAYGATIVYTDPADQGTQNWYGNLGLDFTVNTPVTVTALGVFNATGSGDITGPIDVAIYDFTTSSWVTPTVAFSGTYTPQGDGFDVLQQLITPITLAPGNYQVDAVGFSSSDENGNLNTGSSSGPNLNSLGSALTFTGAAWDFNTSLDAPNTCSTCKGAPAQDSQFDAGTFEVVPEGGTTLVLLGLAVAGLAGLRRKLSV
ncbi:MAG: VPDSG-CTERM sorting domain-containing protein [Candidatus Korobacteraceae bacterium]|jgi:hypothetical protein